MQVILFSAIAGICGTGFGGLIAAIIGKRSPDMTCWLLSLAGGVMTSIVCFGLIPEAVQISNTGISALGLVLGIVIIMVLNRLVDTITDKRKEALKIHHTPEELYHEGRILSNRDTLLRSGMIMFAAISLHNIPEGMAIGAGGSHNFQLGALLAIMIALHNIPEGMAIAAPLLAGDMRFVKVVLLTALSGSPTLLGGIIGVLIGNISNTAIALSLSIAGGAMLYVVFGEILPQSIIMTKNRVTALITLVGFIIGFFISQI